MLRQEGERPHQRKEPRGNHLVKHKLHTDARTHHLRLHLQLRLTDTTTEGARKHTEKAATSMATKCGGGGGNRTTHTLEGRETRHKGLREPQPPRTHP